jgi:hypothetical protein
MSRGRLLGLPLLTLVSMGVGSGTAIADPGLTVTPTTGLAGGDQVTVRVTDLTPGASVSLIQCDQFNNDVEYDCSSVASVVTDGTGAATTVVTLADPVFRIQPFGDPVPVYCRADVCRIFAVWTDDTTQALSSVPLEFLGSPATITATPTADLRKKQKVRVEGTALGAEGQTVDIVEEACFAIIQGSGCYGTRFLRSTTVRSDGTWASKVRVRRFLADGTDCADAFNILGECQLTARVLDASGQPDDSFGISRIGDPGVVLSFRR